MHQKGAWEGIGRSQNTCNTSQKVLQGFHWQVQRAVGKDWATYQDAGIDEKRQDLEGAKHCFTAEYQQSKLNPSWGQTEQPGSTYYLQRVSHDIFGVTDHSNNNSLAYLLDECIGPKTLTILYHSWLTTGISSIITHGFIDLPSSSTMPQALTRISTCSLVPWKWWVLEKSTMAISVSW